MGVAPTSDKTWVCSVKGYLGDCAGIQRSPSSRSRKNGGPGVQREQAAVFRSDASAKVAVKYGRAESSSVDGIVGLFDWNQRELQHSKQLEC